jgi:hypothetical protein
VSGLTEIYVCVSGIEAICLNCLFVSVGQVSSPAARAQRAVSPNGWLLSRRGRRSPANARGVDPHRDSLSARFECRVPGFMSHQSERHFDNHCDAKG